MPEVTRGGAEDYCVLRWSPILPNWNRVQLPFLIRSPKMPAYSGFLAKYTGKSSLQAGKFGLQHMGKLDSFLQVGVFELQQLVDSISCSIQVISDYCIRNIDTFR